MEGKKKALNDNLQLQSPAFTRSSVTLRSPPSLVPKQSSCLQCNEEDNEEMVMCDKCDSWHHFTCADVSASIEHKDWMCDKCTASLSKPASPNLNIPDMQQSVKPNSTKSKVSKSSSARKRKLELQRLEEARELQKQRDEQYLKEKYTLLDAQTSESDEEEEEEDFQDHIKDHVHKWVSETTKLVPNLANIQIATTSTSTVPAISSAFQIRDHNDMRLKSALLPSTAAALPTTNSGVYPPSSFTGVNAIPKEYPQQTLNHFNPIEGSQNIFKTTSVHLDTHTVNASLNVPGYQIPKSILQNHYPSANVPYMHLPHTSRNATIQTAPRVHPTSNCINQPLSPHTLFSSRNMPYEPPTPNVLYAQNTSSNTRAHMPEGANYFPSHFVPQPSLHATQSNYHTLPNIQFQPDTSSNENHQLNRNHFAARQALPKDLISFSGRPEDWPIFYSTFKSTTQICGFTNEENLVRLQRALKGQALEAVRSRLLMPELVPNIIETLRMLYGRPEVLIHTLLEQIRREPAPKADKLETIVNFALSVQNLCATVESSGLTAHLNNPTLLQELTDKLPPQIRLNWALYKQNTTAANIVTLGSWLFEIARAVTDVSVFTTNEDSKSCRSRKERSSVNIHESTSSTTTSSSKSTPKCNICNSTCANASFCESFKALEYGQKWKAVKDYKLCRKCLKKHNQSRCNVDKRCGINNCQMRHHSLLHNPSKDNNLTTTASTSTCNIHKATSERVLFKVIPVVLYGKTSSISTFAFLDDGSSVTMVEEEVADELGLSGSPDPLCLKWTGDTVRVEQNSRRVSMEISASAVNSKKYQLQNVRTVKSLSLPVQSVDRTELEKQYEYLRGLPLESYSGAIPKILIGLDNWKLGLPLEIKEGKWRQPMATKTRVGWIVQGFQENSTQQQSNACHSFHLCECQPNETLHSLVKSYFAIENMGVYKSEAAMESEDVKRAKQIMNSTTKMIKNRFETGLLWKNERIILPDSYPMALRRLACLEKRISMEPQMLMVFKEKIADYILKGYARRLTVAELGEKHKRIWYLPIFTVVNHNKPNKIRLVWDAAAKVAGVSLNSALLTGPDLLSPLNGVLYRFRERKIAICGDIKEMFHQINITGEDQHAQRFLWRNCDQKREPDVYVMQVMTFGACCSPSSAQFVKNQNAEKYVHKYPRAVQAIQRNHYVDDLLDSCDTIEETITLVKQVRHIHQAAGFDIRNFMSNSTEVRRAVTAENSNLEVTNKNLNLDSEHSTEKVLGMWWCTSSDCFKFKLAFHQIHGDVLIGRRKPTKREVLRILMSIFDPLGLLSHFLVYVKVLLQDIWKSGIDWDDQLQEEQQNQWQSWINLLPKVEDITIPRCYVTCSLSQLINPVQLHIFVDASQAAYAAVAYLRLQTHSDTRCVLVGSKTRVAPQKMLSIPRLELQAAVLGIRLAKNMCDQHSIAITERFFWSDSRTVLCWLNSDHRRYRQFVAFRIGEILEDSSLKEWHWISTKMNVADEATKWTKKPELSSDSRWFTGPDFLRENMQCWPIKDEIPTNVIDDSEEVRPHLVVITQPQQFFLNTDRFSNWQRLLKATAYVLRFIFNAKAKVNKSKRVLGVLKHDELQKAEYIIYKEAQRDSFPEELATLEKNESLTLENKRQLQKSSPLYKLSPYVDLHKVLRMHGRVDAAHNLEYDTKRPIILSKNHPVTYLIVMYYHRRYHHHNHETTVNEIRQKYVIPNLRNVLKRTRSKCQKCKNESAKPITPEMGDLPEARLSSYTRPFSYVGVDYFGPMSVVVGRRNEKRWGVLFTCLTIRAIHIELAHSLTTDSCILAIRNFISRRGTPIEFFSDNGTNFHGADNELKKEYAKINEGKVEAEMTTVTTAWSFIPPSSPHMGGSWERLVRSVKQNLKYILPTRKPSDELLRSLLIEIENTINSRPLTFIPVDNSNNEALTPNHFLLGTSNGMKPSGQLSDDVLVLRKNWKISQQLCQQFWRRWLREYLPTITRRTRWFQKVKPIETGDIVVIVDEKNDRNTYPKGIVVETFLGSNGQVRQATVRTPTGVYKRPATKIAVLDVLDCEANNGK